MWQTEHKLQNLHSSSPKTCSSIQNTDVEKLIGDADPERKPPHFTVL